MEVKNFANFCLWSGGEHVTHGHMEELIPQALEYAKKTPGKSVDICFMEFDGDLDDDNTNLIKGQVVLSYHLLHEGNMIVTSGK
ncbi:MAG TPA: hypothetical protein PK430_09845 [Muribaculum sp.]|nr:hypothetical protein [Muribaculum sp.]